MHRSLTSINYSRFEAKEKSPDSLGGAGIASPCGSRLTLLESLVDSIRMYELFFREVTMRSKVWFLGLALLLGAAEPGADDAKNDVEAIQGGWKMVLVFRNGEEVPADQAKNGELVIEDRQYRAKLGAIAVTAAIKVDSSKAPKEIDLTFTTGNRKGRRSRGSTRSPATT